MTNIRSSLEISLGIDEESQIANFQNATLHGVTESIACSIAAFPKYPDKIQSEEQVRAYLTKALAPLIAEGWKFEVQTHLVSHVTNITFESHEV